MSPSSCNLRSNFKGRCSRREERSFLEKEKGRPETERSASGTPTPVLRICRSLPRVTSGLHYVPDETFSSFPLQREGLGPDGGLVFIVYHGPRRREFRFTGFTRLRIYVREPKDPAPRGDLLSNKDPVERRMWETTNQVVNSVPTPGTPRPREPSWRASRGKRGVNLTSSDLFVSRLLLPPVLPPQTFAVRVDPRKGRGRTGR